MNNTLIEFTYIDSNDEVSQYRGQVLKVFWKEKQWLMEVFDLDTKQIRTFPRLSIREIKKMIDL